MLSTPPNLSKLTFSYYFMWSFQVHALLNGCVHDGSVKIPAETVTLKGMDLKTLREVVCGSEF